jgi:hypothetical protein
MRQLAQQVNVNRFRFHLLRWIMNEQLPFVTVKDEDFREMLLSLSISIERYLPHKSTIRNWVMTEFQQSKSFIKQTLKESKSKVHISFDLWTAPNAYAICAITAHFVEVITATAAFC